MSRFRESDPTSTRLRFSSVRKNKPAPTSSTSAIATCTTTRLLLRAVREPIDVAAGRLHRAAQSTFVALRAGSRPKTIPVSMLMPANNPNTRQSAALSPNGIRPPQPVSEHPPECPALLESRMLSVSSWRMSRPRVAPIDRRTDSSRIARGRARQQEARDVGADDQQHDDHDDGQKAGRPARLGQ